MRFPYDVFISYSTKDRPRVRPLAEELRKAGLSVWYDEWVFNPGDEIMVAIQRGLEEARVLLLCLSPNALGSKWVQMEHHTVLFRDPANSSRRFIPLLLADCAVPDTIRRYSYVDYRRKNKGALDNLLRVCRSPQKIDSDGLHTDSIVVPAKRVRKHGSVKSTHERRPRNAPEKGMAVATLQHRSIAQHHLIHSELAYSPDGRWAAFSSENGKIDIWDLESGACRVRLGPNSKGIGAFDISPDVKRIFISESIPASDLDPTTDVTIRVWDPFSARELLPLHGHKGNISCLLTLPNKSRVLSASLDNSIRLWDSSSGATVKAMQTGNSEHDAAFSLAVTHAGNEAVSGHLDGSVRIWDLKKGICLAVLRGHSRKVTSVQVMPDNRHAISGSNDMTIRIWDLSARRCVATLEGHADKVPSVAVSPNGKLIASAGNSDGTVRLWDTKSWKFLQSIPIPHKSSPISVGFSSDEEHLLVGASIPYEYPRNYVYRLSGATASLYSAPSRRYVNAKVVLIGESGAGKTSLAYRLIKDRYVKTDSTHGMNVWRLELPLTKDRAFQREALLWDLAGQDDYRLIHQLFLEETALALLLINPQKDDPFAEARDWLKALNAAIANRHEQRGPAKLLIPTRLDVGGMKVSESKINYFLKEHGFVACLPTSAKRGDNCSDKGAPEKHSKLKQLIAQHIPWDELPWTSTPRLLAEIKKSVIDMRDKADIRLLRFAELAQRLEQALPNEIITEADVRTAITLLGNHGLVRSFKFGDLVLLRPDLLNGYAGAIIRAARQHKDEIGCVTEEEIFNNKFDFTGVERLQHRPDEDLLLRALVQTLLDHSLCIRETEHEQTLLIFPSQYRRDKEITEHPEVFVSYIFSGEIHTVYTTLVVRLWYSHMFQHKELWQNAAEFTTSKGKVVGVLFEKLTEGEGKLNVFFEAPVSEELQVVFIEFIHRHLLKYVHSLRRERRYVCGACGQPVKDMNAVRWRMDRGKDFITCIFCDEHVPLRDHIEERLGSDRVAREVVAWDNRATQALDRQSLEQMLIAHMKAICSEANQIFRDLSEREEEEIESLWVEDCKTREIAKLHDDEYYRKLWREAHRSRYNMNGVVEFKDDMGMASGHKIFIKFFISKPHTGVQYGEDMIKSIELEAKFWVTLRENVYLAFRDADEVIRCMKLTSDTLNTPKVRIRRTHSKLSFNLLWRVRDQLFGGRGQIKKLQKETLS